MFPTLLLLLPVMVASCDSELNFSGGGRGGRMGMDDEDDDIDMDMDIGSSATELLMSLEFRAL